MSAEELQVEAAAQAIYGDDAAWGYVNDYGGGEVAARWEHLGAQVQEMFRLKARAALVAAQGAAPQAESEELAWYKVAAKHSADSMAEARATLQMFADRVDPFVFDELSSVLDDQPLDYETGDVIGEAAPVLPSSTVDEGRIAEVIEKANYDWSRQRLEFWRWAKNVDSPGNLNKFVARAVVEAIGGEIWSSGDYVGPGFRGESRGGNVQKMYDRACADIQEYGGAIERVKKLHAPISSLTWGAPDEFQVCEECNDPDARDFIYWPCPTVAALDGAPEPEAEAEEEMYQAGCGSWDCRAPECGRA